MDEIISLADDAITHCQRVLSEKGRLSTAIPGFVAREAQISLAVAIAKAITAKSTLIAEAGTGTGKTFAYLVPCLLSNKKTLISTATKTLQDQLFQKDLPMLVRALGLSSKVQNLKGRANYICLHRVDLHAEEGRFSQQQAAHELAHIREKLPQLTVGERSELPEIKEDSAVWPYVTSTAENCLGNECSFHQNCFVMNARKRALDADVVVINHHLFFADSRLKEEGFGELLPGVDVVIFDEAHQLAEIASQFHDERFSSRQLRDAVDDLIREWPILDLANQPFKNMALDLDRQLDQLLSAIPEKEERFAWQRVERDPVFKTAWEAIQASISAFIDCIAEAEPEEAGVKRCAARLQTLLDIAHFFQKNDGSLIRWVERFKQSFILHATPYDIAEKFRLLIEKNKSSYIFTSATLTMAASFDCFSAPLGLHKAETLLLPSPFDYQQQAILYLPRGLPDPKHHLYYDALIAKALPIINACGGRCFFLFTSHRALKLVAQNLANQLNYPILVQGDEAKPILLARFRQLGNAVLLGTATFWEGVDVKGEALSCVIIDKLPFASPMDPVTQGKMHYLKSKGQSGFDQLSLPNAVLALKQGVGRLIRDVTDRGVLMIADPRLTGRDYGKQVFASLPSLRKSRDEQTVLHFIDSLALQHETISN